MISAQQVESILRSNNVSPTAPDEVIKSVLLSAKYDANQIDAAIMVLRQNAQKRTSKVDGLHKVFRTDQALSAGEISELLGIEVDAPQVELKPNRKARKFTLLELVLVVILSCILALLVSAFFMHMYGIGPFYSY